MASTPSPRPRLGFIDAARLLAMLLMVQGHVCDTLLSEAARATEFFSRYWLIRGLTGPLFFLLSGMAFVVASDAHWDEYRRPGKRLNPRLRRAVGLLLIGWFFQVPRWGGGAPLNYTAADWTYLFRFGVLHAIAASLLLGHLLLAVTPSRRAFTGWALGAGVLAIAAAPVLAPLDLPTGLGLVVHFREGSLFPVFPFVAYFLFGAVLGRLYLDASGWIGSPRRLGALALAGGVLVISLASIARSLGWALPAGTGDWNASPALFMQRIGGAWLLFAAVALAVGAARSPAWLKEAAGSALSIYVVHLMALYGAPGLPGLIQLVGTNLGLVQAFLAAPALLAACALGIAAWKRGWAWAARALAREQAEKPEPQPGLQ